MGAGSASPVVSRSTASNSFRRSLRLTSCLTRSPRTVQHAQPLSIVINSSDALMFSPTSSMSMFTAPNSFSITTIFLPCCSFRM